MRVLLDKWFDDHYFQPKPIEQDGKLYERLGIRLFQKLLLYQVRKRKDGAYHLHAYGTDGLRTFAAKTRQSERAHILLACLMLLYAVGMSFYIDHYGDLLLVVILHLVNLLTNVYPIFLQRYLRFRIERVLKRAEGRSRR